MPAGKFNGVQLFWEQTGSKGEPLVLVHGSWGDHHNWDKVVSEFAKTFRVLTYDRRGHSKSERLPGQGSVQDDVDDLIALITQLNLFPAHIVGNSYGAGIVLKAAAKQPGIFKSMIIHEPPLFGLLTDNPKAQEALQTVNKRMSVVLDLIAAGNLEKATEEFMEKLAMGPGTWEKLPDNAKRRFINNALTWYDEMQDPQSLQINLSNLKGFTKPALLSEGSESPSFFPLVIDKIKNALPLAKQMTIEGAGHVPHMSHSEKYIEIVTEFCLTAIL
jgi:pimeloyl-ACP methyl ester carboxylesterase